MAKKATKKAAAHKAPARRPAAASGKKPVAQETQPVACQEVPRFGGKAEFEKVTKKRASVTFDPQTVILVKGSGSVTMRSADGRRDVRVDLKAGEVATLCPIVVRDFAAARRLLHVDFDGTGFEIAAARLVRI